MDRKLAKQLVKLLKKYLKDPSTFNFQSIVIWNNDNATVEEHESLPGGQVVCPIYYLIKGREFKGNCSPCPYGEEYHKAFTLCSYRWDYDSNNHAVLVLKSVELLGMLKAKYNI
jgi:hypothetical protein